MKNIKNIVLSIIIVLLFTSNLMAQNTITKPFTIKAGYQQTDLHGDGIDFLSVNGETEAFNSFLIGIEYHSEISKFISFKHELNFNINGAKVTLKDDDNGEYQSTLRMNSLQLQPLNVTFRVKGFQIYAGPYASALLDAKINRKDELGNTYKDKSIFGKPDEETEQNKYLQKTDFGATAGVLFELNKTISLGVRYNHGIVPIFDNTTEQKSIKIYN
ncbi:MAG: PorT family protein, partial [Bacteroidales bacterium]|nr:PorT family protein [Bacteroidales bacterium]